MSVQSEITRLRNAKTQIATAISNKGVTVPNGTSISGMAKLIENIPTGENLDSVIAQQQTLINELSTVLDSKAAGGSGGASIATKSVTVSGYTNLGTIHVSRLVDGQITYQAVKTPTITDVVVGSTLVFQGRVASASNLSVTGCTIVTPLNTTTSTYAALFSVDA